MRRVIYARDCRVVISLTYPQHAEELSAMNHRQPRERQRAAPQRVCVSPLRAPGLAPAFLEFTNDCQDFFPQR